MMSEATWLERKMNWIAIQDSVPPIGRRVLATSESGRVHEAYRNGMGKWRWAHGDIAIAPAITHWMEFPNPPAQFELNRVAAR